MKHRVHESLIYGEDPVLRPLHRICCLLIAAGFLLCGTGTASGIVLHPTGEPNLVTWTDRPDSNVVGRWSYNASFVVIAPHWIATTRHQGTSPTTVIIDGNSYTCNYKTAWAGGPAGNADIRLIRLTAAGGGIPSFAHYASPYTATDEYLGTKGREMRIGGYGRGRETELKTGYVYGYTWGTGANYNNNTLRWCTNHIEGYEPNSTSGNYTSDVLIGYFDVPGYSTYEGSPAEYDSGGGWFIKDGSIWKVAGLTRGVTVHGNPWPAKGESWFQLVPSTPRNGDEIDAVRISSYAAWISGIIHRPGDLTGDDWVNFVDYAVFADQWMRTDCNETNNWCEGADFPPTDNCVDWNDLAFLADKWLTGWKY